ncbi:MAG: glycoside hydrolase family 3 protein [Lachnospiraceae bacterium]
MVKKDWKTKRQRLVRTGLLAGAAVLLVTGTFFLSEAHQKTQCKKESVSGVEEIINKMTIEEKVAQLFIITPEELTGYQRVTAAGEVTKKALKQYPVGGLIYFSRNIQDPKQLKKMLTATRGYGMAINGIPLFLSVDEEGGMVARIGNHKNFSEKKFPNMKEIKTRADAKNVGVKIGHYLYKYGFNLDFAPDADVLSNPKNTVIGSRSFGNDAKKVALLSQSVGEGFIQEKIVPVYKHFPGHGATTGDTHQGFAYTNKTYRELKSCEWVPFISAIKNNAPMLMVGHISAPAVIGDNTPSSMSKVMVTDILRKDLNYKGIIITDAMDMGAITNNYTSAEATVRAIQAGVDLVLMPENFKDSFQAVLTAVKKGTLSEKRINQSLKRILKVKFSENLTRP